jgi:hypothetical protein
MTRRPRTWVWAPAPVKPPEAEKRAVAEACSAFIATVLIPRFLPEIRPSPHGFNHPIRLRGAWHGSAYRFIQRWRTSGQHGLVEEFDTPFARLTYRGPDRFDLDWHRHTGQWWPLLQGLTLAECLAEIETNALVQPIG